MGFVYGLYDPTTQEIRYVGATRRADYKKRLYEHVREARQYTDRNTHKNNWIRVVLSQDLYPIMRILETCPDDSILLLLENEWIVSLTEMGKDLTNTPGIRGNVYPTPHIYVLKVMSEETKRKIGKANSLNMKRNWASEEYREAVMPNHVSPVGGFHRTENGNEEHSNLMKLKWQDPEYRARRIASTKEAMNRPEVKEKLSEKQKANWNDPIYRETQPMKMKGHRPWNKNIKTGQIPWNKKDQNGTSK